jgi:hypothetical protein
MASDGTIDEGQAREALDAAGRASTSARRTGRRFARRYLLLFGVATAAALVAMALIQVLLPDTAIRGAAWGACLGVLIVGTMNWARRQDATARPTGLIIGLYLAWTVVAGLTIAIGETYLVAYPIGVVVGFGVWAAGAWWAGR